MEAFSLDKKIDVNDEKALKGLSEAFGLFSLQDITSAYYKADRNADLAGEILYNMQETASATSALASNGVERSVKSSKPLYGDISEKSHDMNGKVRASKQKWCAVSGGTVSSVLLGKDYVKSVPVANGTCKGSKPMKLDPKEFPLSELWGEEPRSNTLKNGLMQKDMEDFLFRMLGDGFQLERDVIQQVLDKCGYDIQKSVEKLLDFSASTSDKGSKCPSESTEKIVGVCSNSDIPSCPKSITAMSFLVGANGTSKRNEGRLPEAKERNDLQKEVLAALFSIDKAEGLARRKARIERRPRALGDPVVEPLKEYILERKPVSIGSKQDNNNDEDEVDSYQQLRDAVKEYRITMQEYYKAAVDAFAKGDYDQANKLMDKGHFFHEKARKADAESSHKIFETKNVDTQDELMLDLHDHSAKEARGLLKCHLSSLSGIASIKYLKVIIETNEEDASKGARRRLVVKLLEKESIKWTEGEDAGVILIRLDNINRKGLSFAKR